MLLPADHSPCLFEAVDGVRLQSGEDGSKRREIPQLMALLHTNAELHTVTYKLTKYINNALHFTDSSDL